MEKQKIKNKKQTKYSRSLVWPERELNLEHSTCLWKTWHNTMYNYCLQMRWTSKVVNTRDSVRGKTTSRGLIAWCSPHMKAITVLLYRSYSMRFMTWMITFAEDNNIISSIENIITEQGFRLSGVVDRTTTYWLPLHYICLGCPPGCLPRQQIFRKKPSELSSYFYIHCSENICRVYLICCWFPELTPDSCQFLVFMI